MALKRKSKKPDIQSKLKKQHKEHEETDHCGKRIQFPSFPGNRKIQFQYFNGRSHQSIRYRNGNRSHETHRTGRQGRRYAETHCPSTHPTVTEYLWCTYRRRSRIRRTDGSRSLRYQLAETGNPSGSALPVTGLYRNIESYGRTGEARLCGTAILPGRPYPV